MTASTPEEVHRLWTQAFDEGDVDALVALYEPSATLVFQPGEEPARGTEAIREALDGFLSMFEGKPKFDLRFGKAFEAGEDLALVLSTWTMSGSAKDGSPIEMSGQTADVVRRQADGSWRVAIDNPFGDAALA
jgi:uncharacterized protein (TIGR02246 family)